MQTQGTDNIIVNIPKGTNAKQAREQVGTTAQLYFRPVLTTESPAPRRGQPHAQRLRRLHGHRQGHGQGDRQGDRGRPRADAVRDAVGHAPPPRAARSPTP